MAQIYTPGMRMLVVVALLAATMALLHVTVLTARAAGALAIGSCGAYGEAHDFRSLDEAQRNALAKCKGEACRVVASVRRGCAALAVDYANACGGTAGARLRASAPRRTKPCGPATRTARKSASSARFFVTRRARPLARFHPAANELQLARVLALREPGSTPPCACGFVHGTD